MAATTTTFTQVKPGSVPNDWAQFGVQQGWSPSSTSKLKLFLLGQSGTGKSTFLASRPKTLILSFENSAQFAVDQQASYVFIPDADTLDRVMGKLLTEPAGKTFDGVGFDTIDLMADILDIKLAAQYSSNTRKLESITDYGTRGAGMQILQDAVMDYFMKLAAKGYGWIAVTHLFEKSIPD